MRPAIFLDRDGTINVDKGYVFRVDDLEYVDDVLCSLKELYDMGFLLVIITNQSGISRGFFTVDDFEKITNKILADFEANGIKVAGVYYCPHHIDGIIPEFSINCSCRKPCTGLFKKAADELFIDMDNSFAIGDNIRDLSICSETNVKGILLSDKTTEYENCTCCNTWKDVIETIKRR